MKASLTDKARTGYAAPSALKGVDGVLNTEAVVSPVASVTASSHVAVDQACHVHCGCCPPLYINSARFFVLFKSKLFAHV